MKKYLLIIMLLLVVGMLGCFPGESDQANPYDVRVWDTTTEANPVTVQIIGLITDNGTIYATSELLDGSITDLDGIIVGDGSNVSAITKPGGDVVGTTASQELTNKTLNAIVVKGIWTNSGVWTVPAVTVAGNLATSGTSYNIGDNTNHFAAAFLNYVYGSTSQRLVLWDKTTSNYMAFRSSRTHANQGSAFYWETLNDSDVLHPAMSLYGGSDNTTLYVYGDIYALADISALTFTDRTPYYQGDAVAELVRIAGTNGKIDHETLPAFASVVRTYPVLDNDGNTIGYETQKERDLGAMVSMLTVAIKQLDERIAVLEGKQ